MRFRQCSVIFMMQLRLKMNQHDAVILVNHVTQESIYCTVLYNNTSVSIISSLHIYDDILALNINGRRLFSLLNLN